MSNRKNFQSLNKYITLDFFKRKLPRLEANNKSGRTTISSDPERQNLGVPRSKLLVCHMQPQRLARGPNKAVHPLQEAQKGPDPSRERVQEVPLAQATDAVPRQRRSPTEQTVLAAVLLVTSSAVATLSTAAIIVGCLFNRRSIVFGHFSATTSAQPITD